MLGSQQVSLFRTLEAAWELHVQGALSPNPSMILLPIPIHVMSLGLGQGVGWVSPVPKFGPLAVPVHQQDPCPEIPYFAIIDGGVEWWFGPPPIPSL